MNQQSRIALSQLLLTLLLALSVSRGTAKETGTSTALQLLQASQSLYLKANDVLLSGTVRTYQGPPLEFIGKSPWLLAGQQPNNLTYTVGGLGELSTQVLFNGDLYVKDTQSIYNLKSAKGDLKDMYKFVQDANQPDMDTAASAIPAFTFQSDLLTTQNSCLDSLELQGTESIDGTECYVIAFGPCLSEDTRTYYITTETLRLKRFILTTYLSEFDGIHPVASAGESDSYWVSVYDVESHELNAGTAANHMLTEEQFPNAKTGNGYDWLREMESGETRRIAEDIEEALPGNPGYEVNFLKDIALHVTYPEETTISLKKLATFKSDIESVAVRNYDNDTLIYTALENGKIEVLDPSGLKSDEVKIQAEQIEFPNGGPSPIMYVINFHSESHMAQLSAYDTRKSDAEPVILAADAPSFAALTDPANGKNRAALIHAQTESLYTLDGSDGEVLQKRIKAGEEVVARYHEGTLSGYTYYTGGWSVAVELDLDLNFVRNRQMPEAITKIITDPLIANGEMVLFLDSGKVGTLSNEDRFEELRSDSWGYGDESAELMHVAVEKCNSGGDVLLHVYTSKGITVFNRLGRVVWNAEYVTMAGNKAPRLTVDIRPFKHLVDNKRACVLTSGRYIYLLDYSRSWN